MVRITKLNASFIIKLHTQADVAATYCASHAEVVHRKPIEVVEC
jgi:hypothetical protein